MHAPQPHQGHGTLHTSRRRTLQAQVVTLERVQAAVASHFIVSHSAKQQRPRFHDSGLLPLESTRIELEGMRGVLESCWDLSSSTATTPLCLQQQHHQQQQQQQHRQHAQLQRVRRGRGHHVIMHAAPPGAGLPATAQDKTPRQRGASTGSSAQSSLLQAASGVLSDHHTHCLQVVMNLWHVCTTQVQTHGSRDGFQMLSLPKTPRLLTADEECVLGSIIQQHRKLQQLWAEHPDIAAAAFTPPSSSSSTSSTSTSSRHDASTTSSNTSSSSSASSTSTSRQVGPNKKYTWPPALTAEDISEVTQLSQAWRALLPSLAAQAMELLVTFNSGLVLWAMGRVFNQGVPDADLTSAALAGLRVAAQRYNPALGTRFSTVASMWLLQHLQRSSSSESGRVLRRPVHHIAMVSHVLTHHSMDALSKIERRPDVVAEVAKKYKSNPVTVLEILTTTRDQYNASSLEALTVSGKGSKDDGTRTAWANLLTTADLDEEDGQLGMPGEDPGMSGGVGTLLAAAGRVPLWARAGVQDRQQQQQEEEEEEEAGAAGGAGGGGGPAAAPAQLASAAAAAAAAVASPASSVTGTMLDTVDDLESVLQHNMQQMLHILTPLERSVLVTLYGLGQETTPGLGVELPPVSVYGSISSNIGSNIGRSSSSGDSSPSSPGKQQKQPQQQRVKKWQAKASSAARKAAKGVVTLQEVATALHLPSAYAVTIIRDSALKRLAAAAAAAAAALPGSSSEKGVATTSAPSAAAAAAADRSSSSTSSSGPVHSPAPGAAAAAAAAVAAGASTTAAAATAEPAARTGRLSYGKGDAQLQMVGRVQSFVAERGHLPEDMQERYQGKLLGRWVSRIRGRFWRGQVCPSLAAAIEQLVPGWDWGSPGSVRERYLQRKREREKRERAAAAAAAAAAAGGGGAAAAGGGDSSAVAAAGRGASPSRSDSSSRKQVLLNRFARAGAARRTRVIGSVDGPGEAAPAAAAAVTAAAAVPAPEQQQQRQRRRRSSEV